MIRTWHRSPRRALLVVLALLVPLLSGLPMAVLAQTANEVEIHILDTGFDPDELTIPVNSSVTWVNHGTEEQTLVSVEGDFDSQTLAPGAAFADVVLTAPGSYNFELEGVPDATLAIEVTAGVRDLDLAVSTEEPTAPAGTSTPTASLTGPSQNLTSVETPRLAHIHAGTCEDLGIVVYSLNGPQNYLLEPDGETRGPAELLVGVANVSLADLFSEPFSIHIHQDAVNKQNYIACADIGGQPDAPWTEAEGLVLNLVEQADSGMRGFASLEPGPDGSTVVSLYYSGAAEAGAQQAAANTTPPSNYTSPTFGYSIAYNDTWDVSEDVTSNGRDRFVVTNGTSYVTFTGAEGFNGDPQQCVDTFSQELAADPNVSDIAVARDADGQPLIGSTPATGAFAIYNHQYQFSTGSVPYTLFIGCIPLIPGEAVLAVVQNSPTADFDGQIAPRESLLRGLSLNQ